MITIRPATAADQEALGRFGGALMRQHHAADPLRFIQVEHPEAGYGRFLVSQLTNPASVVLVADRSGEVVGYVWADVEGISWKDLRGPCGYVHDIFVDESASLPMADEIVINEHWDSGQLSSIHAALRTSSAFEARIATQRGGIGLRRSSTASVGPSTKAMLKYWCPPCSPIS